MIATEDIETLPQIEDLPPELRRSSGGRPRDERIARILSGLTAARQAEDVICPMLLRRNLVVPAGGRFSQALAIRAH